MPDGKMPVVLDGVGQTRADGARAGVARIVLLRELIEEIDLGGAAEALLHVGATEKTIA